jgi:putative spermidine/putrescine transport system ATP-binding protein
MADRVCVMSKGHIEQVATPAELYSRPSTAFVAQFVGISSRYPVDATNQRVELFGQQSPVRSGEGSALSGPADALLRPEDVTIDVDPTGQGFITRKSFLGAMTRLTVQIGEIPVRVDLRSDRASEIELGTRVRMSVVARDVLIAPRQPIIDAPAS